MICPHCNKRNYPGIDSCSNCKLDLSSFDVPVAHDRVERSLMEDPVGVVKPPPAVILHASTPVSKALDIMIDQNIGALLVVDDQNKMLGIFSERDMLNHVLDDPTDYAEKPISDYMTEEPETVRTTDRLAFVLHKMDNGGYRHLPVLKDGKPIAMISVRDMLKHILYLCNTH
ncbi:MAG: CBS domain-containing protein [Planctomycetota bacterium]|jgi:CBS domain-containing protein|nr:CBS domain-containing protein [Planctomycetota bacterium]